MATVHADLMTCQQVAQVVGYGPLAPPTNLRHSRRFSYKGNVCYFRNYTGSISGSALELAKLNTKGRMGGLATLSVLMRLPIPGGATGKAGGGDGGPSRGD